MPALEVAGLAESSHALYPLFQVVPDILGIHQERSFGDCWCPPAIADIKTQVLLHRPSGTHTSPVGLGSCHTEKTFWRKM